MNEHTDRPAPWQAQRGRALPWLIAVALSLAAGGLWWWQGHGRAPAPVDAAASAASAGGARAHGADAWRAGGGGAGSGGRDGPGGGRRFGGGNATQPVSVETVRRQDMHVSVNAIGSLAATNTAVVRAQVSGVVQRLNLPEGQPVRAGQLLAQLDPRAFEATLAQAEGVLARDRAQLEGARLDLVRYRELLSKDAAPKQQVDTQATLVAQLEGTVKADQGTVDNARLQLSYTRVTAPIDGRLGFKQVDLGNMTTPNDANGIVSITQTRPIALVFAVPAVHLSAIQRGLRSHLPLLVQARERGTDRPLAEGRVAAVDNAIDPATDTIKVKALFPNADDSLFPNEAVNVRLQLDTLHQALAVPQAAVLRGAQGFLVYLVRPDGTVTARPVKPGPVDAGWMAVDGELQAGDRVVIDGSDRLREGARVEVIDAAAAQRHGPSATAASAASATTATGQASAAPSEHPRSLDRLPPEVAAKVQAMSPDERRAWFQAQRQARDAAAPR